MAWLIPALAASLAGAVMVYLASPHQRWRSRPWPAAARAAGLALWALSLVAWGLALRPPAAVFGFTAWSMLLLTTLPALGAWRQAALRRTAGRSTGVPSP